MSLPQGLPDFYAETIWRLPNNSNTRLETYTMLEIVLCAEGELGMKAFWAAFACARCVTLSDCQRAIKPGTLSLALAKNFQKRIQERCGGLLEVIPSNYPMHLQRVRFMHQSVKDFVSSTETFGLVVGSAMEKPWENGCHFLTKSNLTLELTDSSHLPVSVSLILEYPNEAETSSGMSHRSFLDSIPDELLGNYSWRRRYSFPINSVLSFAVVANLRLYLEQRLLQYPLVNQNPKVSLLHCAVLATINDTHLANDGWDRCQIASFLMKHGADKEALFNGLTPFQALFCNEYEGFGSGGPRLSDIGRRMISVFLSHGQDPDSKILPQARYQNSVPHLCRPLHLVNGALAETFLHYGANVNALNEKGHTPLDIAYGIGWNVYEIGDHCAPATAYSHAMHLISKGGCVTDAIDEILQDGKSYFNIFLEILSRNFSIDARLRNPPRLPQDLS